MQRIRIGTRASQLARWQARYVANRLAEANPDCRTELVEIVSAGDRLLELPLYTAGGKGLFLKELEAALVDGTIDIAVHSMKDVPVQLPPNLIIPVVCARADPRDAFISNHYASIEELPAAARVGTCSLRRKCQLAARRPELQLINLRGNVNTRLAKLDAGEYDAIILAVAGLIRLDLARRITRILPPEICLPAVGQGVIGIQCRQDDNCIRQCIAPLNDAASETMIRSEREVNRLLEGGCHAPLACYAELHGPQLELRALVGTVDGRRVVRSHQRGAAIDPEGLAATVARDLKAQGALEIMAVAPHAD